MISCHFGDLDPERIIQDNIKMAELYVHGLWLGPMADGDGRGKETGVIREFSNKDACASRVKIFSAFTGLEISWLYERKSHVNNDNDTRIQLTRVVRIHSIALTFPNHSRGDYILKRSVDSLHGGEESKLRRRLAARKDGAEFLSAFAKLWNVAAGFVTSFHWNNSAPSGRISKELDNWVFFQKSA